MLKKADRKKFEDYDYEADIKAWERINGKKKYTEQYAKKYKIKQNNL